METKSIYGAKALPILRRLGTGDDFRSRVVTLAGATGMANVLNIAAVPLITRLYSAESFGYLQIYASISAFLIVVIGLRYELAIVIPEKDETAAELMVLTLVSVVFMTGCISVAVYLACRYELLWRRGSELEQWIWVLPVGALALGIYQALSYWALRHHGYRDVAGSKFSQIASQAFVQVGAGLYTHGALGGLLAGDACGRIGGTVWLAKSALRRDWKLLREVRPAGLLRTCRRFRKFPLMLTGAGLLNTAGLQAVPVLLSGFYGARIVGLYALADRILQIPAALIGQAVSQVYMVRAAELSKQDSRALRRLFLSIVSMSLLCGLPILLVLLLIAPRAFALIFGESWRAAGQLARVLLPVYYLGFIHACTSMTLPILECQGWQAGWDALRLVAVSAVLIVTGRGGLTSMSALSAFAVVSATAYGLQLVMSYRAILLCNCAAELPLLEAGRAADVKRQSAGHAEQRDSASRADFASEASSIPSVDEFFVCEQARAEDNPTQASSVLSEAASILRVEMPAGYDEERRYICAVLLDHFLGLKYQLVQTDRRDVRITCPGSAGEIRVEDIFFATPSQQWLTPASLPRLPLPILRAETEPVKFSVTAPDLPVLYGRAAERGHFVHVDSNSIRVGVDVFGSTFFMLSRYEELAGEAEDRYERFPAENSVAVRAGFLQRPLVNEYLELLWTCLQRQWPRLRRRARDYQVVTSHDVDFPFAVVAMPRRIAWRGLAGDICARRDWALAGRRLEALFASGERAVKLDPFNTFSALMDFAERHGLRSTFLFIPGWSQHFSDPYYSLDDPAIRGLMRTIADRGHEIGCHPSYNTCNNPARFQREFDNLRRVCDDLGIAPGKWRTRQHCLRWKAPVTWQICDDSGLAYDESVTYASAVGFRCGTCYEFPVFNLKTRRALQLVEQPLTVMDFTLLRRDYMGLTHAEAMRLTAELAAKCRQFHGDFRVLWHNSSVATRAGRTLFETILADAVA